MVNRSGAPLILVVDDDEETRDVLREILRDEGYRVIIAPHGAYALSVVEALPIDLVILDLKMPRMDGREFPRAYRAMSGERAPVLGLTASPVTFEADAVLHKPFDRDELSRLVRSFVEPSPAAE